MYCEKTKAFSHCSKIAYNYEEEEVYDVLCENVLRVYEGSEKYKRFKEKPKVT
ncbi:hypothetical protein bcere0007_24010 [Bacillus mycoides]|uniref:hypothetical protein n=1 Tax=Bacillus sp. TH19 TaxID=2796385 RepID=UPI0001A02041|nr:hypothetical protein [Bacillus sp. TH19]EEK73087.1 hypothetical protein bcere0007_24010 [Bacillus mycoides]